MMWSELVCMGTCDFLNANQLSINEKQTEVDWKTKENIHGGLRAFIRQMQIQ